jgi:protein arginine kinase
LTNSDLTQLITKQDFWSRSYPNSDTVLSSKVQLVRNIFGIPFQYRQTQNNINQLRHISEQFIIDSSFPGLELIDINSIDGNTRRFLRERNIISQNMEIIDNCFVILSKNDDFNILVNDEDHFKIQIVKPGLQFLEAYRLADEVDNQLNKCAAYAFSDDLGYISSNPLKNTFRISAAVHLPVLSFTKRINEIQNIVKLSRAGIEGLKEEGIKTFGNLFVISNGFTTGNSETEVIEQLEKLTHNIISMESEARDSYIAEHSIRLEDKICRSYGILKYARKIGYVEAMDYLSDIRLGIILSKIKNINLQKINHLMINIQWSHLQKIENKNFATTIDGDIFRASYLRDQLEWSTVNG